MPHPQRSPGRPVIVLIHSPLVGPLTWAPVSAELRRRGVATVLPVLADDPLSGGAYWLRHAQAVARRLEALPPDTGVLLVGHSGAGPLLPAFGAFSPHPVAGYLFVDAALPHPGQSALQEIEAGGGDFAAALRMDLDAGGAFPDWTDEVLRELIPNPVLRAGVLAEISPRRLDFFEEPHPVVERWPDAPCAYLRLSVGYDEAAQEARRRGWPYHEFDAGHFHMLADPPAVADAILDLQSVLASR
jgi:pimeloyl-ACP methyl ester carboxylesterase